MGKAYYTTYSYDAEFAYNSSKGRSEKIFKETVKFIMIDHDYQKRIMPVIYLKVDLPYNLYNMMVPDQGKGKIYMSISSIRTKGSTSSAPKKVIYDDFDYFMTDDPNAFTKLDQSVSQSTTGLSYKECYIGLLKTDLQRQNKKTFEGVYKNTNTISLVKAATSGMKIVIQPFVNNVNIESFTCPPVTSVGQFLAYLNQNYNFYNGNYLYYMDFDKTYLISNDGSYVNANDITYPTIAFDIRDLTNIAVLSTGMVEDNNQDAYIVFVHANDAQIIIDRVASDQAGQIASVNHNGESKAVSVDTSAITCINANLDGMTIVQSNDPNAAQALATKLAESADTLTIVKMDMDARAFAPNKQYLLSNYQDNPKYCGIYYMVSKKEIYLRTGNQYTCQMTITLRRSADYVKLKRSTEAQQSVGPGGGLM